MKTLEIANKPPLPAKNSAYENGMAAYRSGADWWQNPHAHRAGAVMSFQAWFAGWCYAKQLDKDQGTN